MAESRINQGHVILIVIAVCVFAGYSCGRDEASSDARAAVQTCVYTSTQYHELQSCLAREFPGAF